MSCHRTNLSVYFIFDNKLIKKIHYKDQNHSFLLEIKRRQRNPKLPKQPPSRPPRVHNSIASMLPLTILHNSNNVSGTNKASFATLPLLSLSLFKIPEIFLRPFFTFHFQLKLSLQLLHTPNSSHSLCALFTPTTK